MFYRTRKTQTHPLKWIRTRKFSLYLHCINLSDYRTRESSCRDWCACCGCFHAVEIIAMNNLTIKVTERAVTPIRAWVITLLYRWANWIVFAIVEARWNCCWCRGRRWRGYTMKIVPGLDIAIEITVSTVTPVCAWVIAVFYHWAWWVVFVVIETSRRNSCSFCCCWSGFDSQWNRICFTKRENEQNHPSKHLVL